MVLSALTVGCAWLIIWAISPMKSPIPCICNNSRKRHPAGIQKRYAAKHSSARDAYAFLVVLIVIYSHIVEEPFIGVGEYCTRTMGWEHKGSTQ
jgi:hypothetical protein